MTAKTWVTSKNNYLFGYKIVFNAKLRILRFTVVWKCVDCMRTRLYFVGAENVGFEFSDSLGKF